MTKIKLTKAINIKGVETKELELDFEKLTGKQLIQAEREVRLKGDQTPSVFLSMNFQAAVAAKLIGIPVDDLEDLPARDFAMLTASVTNFLFNAE